jgi:hypothetical protein
LKDKSIGLIKWWKAGLEKLLASTCITRRIRRRAIRDYQIGECQNSAYQFKDCTYKSLLNCDILGCGLRVEITYPG